MYVCELCSKHEHAPIESLYVSYFVKNCRNLRVVRTQSLEDEYAMVSTTIPMNQGSEITASTGVAYFQRTVNTILEEYAADQMDVEPPNQQGPIIPGPCMIHWYIALRACDSYYTKHHKWPGLLTDTEQAILSDPDTYSGEETDESEWLQDINEVGEMTQQFLFTHGIFTVADFDVAHEMVRSRACEPHVVAAFVGEVGAQIGLKVLLQQYVPLNNTLLYNGINCKASTYQL